MQRDALGMPDLVPVVIDHPLSTLADTQITARAEQAMVQCVATWTGNGDAASPELPRLQAAGRTVRGENGNFFAWTAGSRGWSGLLGSPPFPHKLRDHVGAACPSSQA